MGLIDDLRPGDWTKVRRIYEEGIRTGEATFETAVPEWEEWSRTHRQDCRLVYRNGDLILGWAALSPVSDRCVYGGVAEVSVYVGEAARGQGVGKALLQALVERSEGLGVWTLQAGIFRENRASVALHEACGFRTVGVRERLGNVNGQWRDVLFLERRSDVAGT